MTQLQKMAAAGKKCAVEYPHRRTGGQAYDDLPLTALDRHGCRTRRATYLVAAWNVGFVGGEIPNGATLQLSDHGAGRKSVQVVVGGQIVGDYNV